MLSRINSEKMAEPLINLPTALLGEGPLWHQGRKSFFWVDIEGMKIHEYEPKKQRTQSWRLPSMPGMFSIETDDTLIVAMQGGISRLHLRNDSVQNLIGVEKSDGDMRPNDGKCDAYGRIWLGTMHLQAMPGEGSLYCIEGEKVEKKLTGLSIPNGIAWTDDHHYMYFIDSATYKVDRYHFDVGNAAILFDCTVIEVAEHLGMPDGMSIDDEGMLWIGHWGGNAVRRWNPYNGQIMQTIEVAATQVTSCAFGGENLNELFITTASTGLSDHQITSMPHSGKPFIIDLQTTGVPTYHFGIR